MSAGSFARIGQRGITRRVQRREGRSAKGRLGGEGHRRIGSLLGVKGERRPVLEKKLTVSAGGKKEEKAAISPGGRAPTSLRAHVRARGGRADESQESARSTAIFPHRERRRGAVGSGAGEEEEEEEEEV
ncbi:hypothetical protein KM043_000378 [Ampulex compressa]|nr:hypothetical protein KM043_000378 [Ampulex compressa]